VILSRNIVHALLALLLVFSQQMGISHVVSHVSAQRHAGPQQLAPDLSVSKVLALDQLCEQCVAFAQIASALDTPFQSFPLANPRAPLDSLASPALACRRTACVFQPRAPPAQA
jgi:hypothetical protein